MIWTSVKFMICSKSVLNLMDLWCHISCQYQLYQNFMYIENTCILAKLQIWSGYPKKQNLTSQFEKQGLRILSIRTFHRLLLDYRLNAHPERLPAYMRALAFWSSRCCRQIQITSNINCSLKHAISISNLINYHEEPLGVIKLDASSREAGQDSGSILRFKCIVF
jgi:hypothetical protein